MYTILLRLANVLLIGVLNGAFVFTADLVRYLNFDCEVDFIRVSSYKGTQSIGSIELNLHLKYEVKGRDVILIDDILDTGLTLHELRKYFLNLQCASVEVCVFCRKPTCVKHDIDAKYVGLDLPSPEFIVGYGLDYNEKGRNLPSIYKKCG